MNKTIFRGPRLRPSPSSPREFSNQEEICMGIPWSGIGLVRSLNASSTLEFNANNRQIAFSLTPPSLGLSGLFDIHASAPHISNSTSPRCFITVCSQLPSAYQSELRGPQNGCQLVLGKFSLRWISLRLSNYRSLNTPFLLFFEIPPYFLYTPIILVLLLYFENEVFILFHRIIF